MAISPVKYTCNVSQKQDAKGQKVNTLPLTMTFDFSGVTESQLVNEAVRNIVVKLQGKMRSATTRKDKPLSWQASVSAYNGKTIKVADALKDTRSRKSPEDRRKALVKDADKLDDAAKKALIAELTKSLRK